MATKSTTPKQDDLEPVAGEGSVQQSLVMAPAGEKGAFIPAPPLAVVTQMQGGREDGNALTGHFVDVVGGEHKGKYGVLDYIATVDKHGAPLTGVVVTRDDDAQTIVCDYSDLARAEAGRR